MTKTNLLAEEEECVGDRRRDAGEREAVGDRERRREEQRRVLPVLVLVERVFGREDHRDVIRGTRVVERAAS